MKERFKKTTLGKWLLAIKHAFPIAHPVYSYSQLGEDILLDHFVQYKKDGFYVDIGAYDPVSISNTYKFYKRGWKGIQIEPNAKRSPLFKRYRPGTITLTIGIGLEEGIQTFYHFQEESLSTFSKESADLNQSLGNTLLDTQQVQVLPLSAVFAQYLHGRKIDILSVDTEGYDMEVLKTNDWRQFRPAFVVVETAEYGNELLGKKLNDRYDPYMESLGYQKVADTYLNTIYMDRHHG
jgi:FkbM family methyltransferase